MKCLCITGLFLMLTYSFSAQTDGIKFETVKWEQILDKSNTQNKLVFLDAYASWCGPCKWMDANVFTEEKVGSYMNEHFVNAKIDMEKGEGPELAKKYGVRAYPTYLVVDANGELVHRFCGSMPVDRFLENVQDAKEPDSSFSIRTKRYQEMESLSANMAMEYVSLLENACLNTRDAVENIYSEIPENGSTLSKWSTFIGKYPPGFDTDYFQYLVSNSSSQSPATKEQLQAGILKAARSHLMSSLRKGKEDYQKAVNEVKLLELANEDEILAHSNYYFYRTTGQWEEFVEATEKLLQGERRGNASFLNSAAWAIYENVDSSHTALLQKGLDWAKQSVELEKGYANMDTYAALLYKSGDKMNGKRVAEEAIKIAKAKGQDYSGTVELMEKY